MVSGFPKIDPCVNILTVRIRIEASSSLKDRRRVVRSLLDKIRNRWDVSAMDMGPDNDRSFAVLGFSAIGTSRSMADERLSAVLGFLEDAEGSGTFEVGEIRERVLKMDDPEETFLRENEYSRAAGETSGFFEPGER